MLHQNHDPHPSIKTARRFKLHRSLDSWAAGQLHQQPANTVLIARDGLKVAGTKWTGLKTAVEDTHGQHSCSLGPVLDEYVPDVNPLVARFG